MNDLIQVCNKIEDIEKVVYSLEDKGLRERNGYLKLTVNVGNEPTKWAFIEAKREKLTTFKTEVKASQMILFEQQLKDIGLSKFSDYFVLGSGEFRDVHFLGGIK